MREFQIDITSYFVATAGQQGQQKSLRLQPMLRTQEESGSLFYHQDILKKQLRKDQSSTGGTQTQRYISSAFTYPDKALSLTALSFLLLSYFI